MHLLSLSERVHQYKLIDKSRPGGNIVSEEMCAVSSPGGIVLSKSEITSLLWEEERNTDFSARPFLILSLYKPVQIMLISLQIF